MRIAALPGSPLVLIEYSKGFRLFCAESLGLCEVLADSWSAAVNEGNEARKIWPQIDANGSQEAQKIITLVICLTLRCSLECEYCYLGGSGNEHHVLVPQRKQERISFFETEIAKCLLSRPSQLVLNFFGGEPLIEKETLQEIAEFAQKQSDHHQIPIKLGVTTNGTLLTKDFLTWAKTKKVRLMVSLDSPMELHDRYRARGKSGASFQNILGHLDGDQDSVIAATVITRQTPSLRLALQSLMEHGFNRVAFNLVTTHHHELALSQDDCHRFLAELEADGEWFEANSHRIENIARLHTCLRSRLPRLAPCNAGRGSSALGPDAKRYFCHRCVGDTDYILEGGPPAFPKVLDSVLPFSGNIPECAECWARRLCGGDCWLVRRSSTSLERNVRCQLTRAIVRLAVASFPPIKQP